MGRKKQKVKWTSVEEEFFGNNETTTAETMITENSAGQQNGNTETNANNPPDPDMSVQPVKMVPTAEIIVTKSPTGGYNVKVANSQTAAVTSVPAETSQTSNHHSHYNNRDKQRHNSDSSSVSNHHNGHGGGSNGHHGGQGGMRYYGRRYGGPRRYGYGPVAPRFERKLHSDYHNGMTPEDCEAEDLPNGFTKIRSKNLDVLFKKDYYAQKMLSTSSSEQGDEDAIVDELSEGVKVAEPVQEEGEEEDKLDKPDKSDKSETAEASDLSKENGQNKDDEADVQENSDKSPEDCPSLDKDNDPETAEGQQENEENEEEEEKPKKFVIKSKMGDANTEPFKSAATMSVSSASGAPGSFVSTSTTATRPNLYLYSPSSNTMIPCEEIIMPSPVLGYQGPSNIYLAFPVDNTTPSTTPPTVATTSSNALAAGTQGDQTTQSPTPSLPAGQYVQTANGQAASSSYVAPSMVQYDQYGVPYTTYHPQQQHQLTTGNGGNVSVSGRYSTQASVSAGSDGMTTATDPSSAESTTPHSPPDLSVYSPANWTMTPTDPATAAMAFAPHQTQPALGTGSAPTGAGGGQQQQQWSYYHHQQYYPASSNPAAGALSQQSSSQHPQQAYYGQHHDFANYFPDSSTVPSSSAGESPNENRSEAEDDAVHHHHHNNRGFPRSPRPNSYRTGYGNSHYPGSGRSSYHHGGKRSHYNNNSSTTKQTEANSANNSQHNPSVMPGGTNKDTVNDVSGQASTFIPGLPAASVAKKPTKKKRKKKTALATAMSTTTADADPKLQEPQQPQQQQHRGSSSFSEAGSEVATTNNMLQIATATVLSSLSAKTDNATEADIIADVEANLEMKEEGTKSDFQLPEVLPAETPEEQEQPVVAPVQVGPKKTRRRKNKNKSAAKESVPEAQDEAVATTSLPPQQPVADSVPVDSPAVVEEHTTTDGKQPEECEPQAESEPAANVAKEESDLTKPSAEEDEQSKVALAKTAAMAILTKSKPESHQWETVPPELTNVNKWKTSTSKRSRKSRQNASSPEARPETPPPSPSPPEVIVTEPEAFESAANKKKKEPKSLPKDGNKPEAEKKDAPSVEPTASVVDALTESNSAPTSRKSTLKRSSRKKQSSFDSANSSSLLSRPVLINDNDFDVATVAAQRRLRSKLGAMDELKVRSPTDALYVSDIGKAGYGLGTGPMTIGRARSLRYVPPDRSSEIHPIPMQGGSTPEKSAENPDPDLAKSKSVSDLLTEDTSTGEKHKEVLGDILKAMMDEAFMTRSSSSNYIRDAERFAETLCSNSGSGSEKPGDQADPAESGKTVQIPDILTKLPVAKKQQQQPADDLDLD